MKKKLEVRYKFIISILIFHISYSIIEDKRDNFLLSYLTNINFINIIFHLMSFFVYLFIL